MTVLEPCKIAVPPIFKKPVLFVIKDATKRGASAALLVLTGGQSGLCSDAGKWKTEDASSAALTLPSKDWASEHSAEPEKVRQFCNKHGLLADAIQAVQLAQGQFVGSNPTLCVEQDPESGTEWLVVDVLAKRPASKAMANYRAFVRAWVAVAKSEAIRLIRTNYRLN